jgi:hypothetical protein
MKQSFPGIVDVQRPTDWEMNKATNATQTVLSTRKVDCVPGGPPPRG